MDALQHNAVALKGDLALAGLERLTALLASADGRINVALELRRETDRTRWLRGNVQGTVDLVCQRCERVHAQSLALRLDLRLLASEAEEASLLSECDTVVVEGESLPLWSVLEDELMLALPMMPRCADCLREVDALPAAGEEPLRTHTPFAGLQAQLAAGAGAARQNKK